MKRTIRTLALIATLAVSFTACKKDKEEAANQFTYEGKSYELKSATAVSGNGWTEVTFYNVATTPTSGTYSTLNISLGRGDLAAGTYSYLSDDDANFDEAKNFYDASASIDINYETLDRAIQVQGITAGNVTITKDGSNYKVVYNLTFGAKTITGNYSGAIVSNQ